MFPANTDIINFVWTLAPLPGIKRWQSRDCIQNGVPCARTRMAHKDIIPSFFCSFFPFYHWDNPLSPTLRKAFRKNILHIVKNDFTVKKCIMFFKRFVAPFQHKCIMEQICTPPKHSSDLEAACYKQPFAVFCWAAPLEQMGVENWALFNNLLKPKQVLTFEPLTLLFSLIIWGASSITHHSLYLLKATLTNDKQCII